MITKEAILDVYVPLARRTNSVSYLDSCLVVVCMLFTVCKGRYSVLVVFLQQFGLSSLYRGSVEEQCLFRQSLPHQVSQYTYSWQSL